MISEQDLRLLECDIDATQEIIDIFKGDHEGPDDGDELYPERNR